MRLDIELVNRNIFDTRNKAQMSIKDSIVEVNGKVITKPSYDVSESDDIKIVGEVMPYVSRGGYKLEKAIKVFELKLENKTMLDIGSSTGGFTDCALQNGVMQVIACDVGSDQMASSLRNDERVLLFENTDFRDIDKDIINKADLATIDVSFISVTKIIDVFHELENLKEVMCLIKPQFECGKQVADKYKGIINDPNVHKDVINKVIEAFKIEGYSLKNISVSPIKGGSGNIEYISYFVRSEKESSIERFKIESIISDAFSTK